MHSTREIKKDIIYVGASDRRLALFENLFPLTDGVAYNSYVILDEKTVLLDTVDASISMQYLENVEYALKGRTLDYLVINHMEPDHCANIESIVFRYPHVKLVGNTKTFQFFEQFYNLKDQENYYVVKEGDELSLGKRTLKFFMAPMVHWPEVMMTYETTEGILFSADAFGAFGALDGNIFADEFNYRVRTADEARRYYVNIVGKYGVNVMNVMKKFNELPINMICPLHGPVLRTEEDVTFLRDKYTQWATYEAEEKSVLLIYGSMYGNTENAISYIAHRLANKGIRNIRIYDVSKTDPSYIISDMWVYSNFVIASPNYNGDVYFKVENLLREALSLSIKKRKVSFVTNFSWGGKALKTMQELLETGKDIEFIGEPVEIKSSVKEENEEALEALAEAIAQSVSV